MGLGLATRVVKATGCRSCRPWLDRSDLEALPCWVLHPGGSWTWGILRLFINGSTSPNSKYLQVNQQTNHEAMLVCVRWCKIYNVHLHWEEIRERYQTLRPRRNLGAGLIYYQGPVFGCTYSCGEVVHGCLCYCSCSKDVNHWRFMPPTLLLANSGKCLGQVLAPCWKADSINATFFVRCSTAPDVSNKHSKVVA